jgi:hypothetical protein
MNADMQVMLSKNVQKPQYTGISNQSRLFQETLGQYMPKGENSTPKSLKREDTGFV